MRTRTPASGPAPITGRARQPGPTPPRRSRGWTWLRSSTSRAAARLGASVSSCRVRFATGWRRRGRPPRRQRLLSLGGAGRTRHPGPRATATCRPAPRPRCALGAVDFRLSVCPVRFAGTSGSPVSRSPPCDPPTDGEAAAVPTGPPEGGRVTPVSDHPCRRGARPRRHRPASGRSTARTRPAGENHRGNTGGGPVRPRSSGGWRRPRWSTDHLPPCPHRTGTAGSHQAVDVHELRPGSVDIPTRPAETPPTPRSRHMAVTQGVPWSRCSSPWCRRSPHRMASR